MIAAARNLVESPERAPPQFAAAIRKPRLSAGQALCVVVVCGVLAAACRVPLAHTDLWGHLAYGRWIDEHGALPAFEPFLQQTRPATYQPHAWLAQWAGFRAFEAAGAAGLVTVHAALLALALGLTGLALAHRGLTAPWIAAGMLAAYVVAAPQWAVIRPQLFGGALFPLVLIAIDRLPRSVGPLVWLPLAFALWAQLHGSWIVGLGWLLLTSLGAAVDALARRSDAWAWRSVARGLACTALSLMAVCTNPAGPRGVWDAVALAAHPNLASMREWLPLGLADGGAWRFLGTLAATGLALRVSPRRWRCAELLPLALLAIAVFDTRRMLTWWALAWPWSVAPHLAARWPLKAAWWRAPRLAPTLAAAAAAAVSVALLACPLLQVLAGWRAVDDPCWFSPGTPRSAAAELERAGLAGRVYAPMEWSDYLMWTSRGRAQPLVNSHVHLIDPQVWRDYRAIGRGHASWKQLLVRHGVRALVLDPRAQSDLLALVAADPEFSLAYRDGQSAIYRWRAAP